MENSHTQRQINKKVHCVLRRTGKRQETCQKSQRKAKGIQGEVTVWGRDTSRTRTLQEVTFALNSSFQFCGTSTPCMQNKGSELDNYLKLSLVGFSHISSRATLIVFKQEKNVMTRLGRLF